MPELNKANRQACDIDIREVGTRKPFLYLDTANVTTAGISGSSVYALKKGMKAIAFHDPIEGTLTIEAQVIPFKLYSLFSDGTIESTAMRSVKKTVTCETAGALSVTIPATSTVETGTVFVYAEGEFGGDVIEGTFADGTFTATTAADIEVGKNYDIGYVELRTANVKRVVINDTRTPKAYYIEASTLDKDEDDVLTPFIMTAYKAVPQRNFEISLSSTGDPVTISLVFDLMADKAGNVFDMVEDTSEE